MESTAMGLMRGTVLAVFVLGLPALALVGVPDEVRVFLESDMLPWNKPTTQSLADVERTSQSAAATSTALDAAPVDHQPQPPSFFARAGSIHARGENQAEEAAASHIELASAEARVLHQPVYRPLAAGEKAEVVRHMPAAESPAQSQGETPSEAARMRDMEARLRELGALNYQLQQQASAGQYRFVCLCENERGEQRVFEAHSEDRLQALQLVLEQIAAWRRKEVVGYYRQM